MYTIRAMYTTRWHKHKYLLNSRNVLVSRMRVDVSSPSDELKPAEIDERLLE